MKNVPWASVEISDAHRFLFPDNMSDYQYLGLLLVLHHEELDKEHPKAIVRL